MGTDIQAIVTQLAGPNLSFALEASPALSLIGRITTRKPHLFGSVLLHNVPLSCGSWQECVVSHFNVPSGSRTQIDDRILWASTIVGAPFEHWPDLDWALKRGYKPFDMWLRKPESLSWIEIGLKIIPYVGEAYLPPLEPVWLGTSRMSYFARLAEFYESLSPDYLATPWGVGEVRVVDEQ